MRPVPPVPSSASPVPTAPPLTPAGGGGTDTAHPTPARSLRPTPSTALAHGTPVVGVVINTVGGYSRGVLRGIASYAMSRAWTLRVAGVNGPEFSELDARFDGIIVQASTPAVARRFARVQCPVVNVSSALSDPGLHTVVTDDFAVGRMGAEHLLRLGHRSLVFYAPDRRAFARVRSDGFSRRCQEARAELRVLSEPAALRELLATARPPLGIMGCNDRAALTVLELCRVLPLKVPEEVAVVGVDDDDLVQAMAYPPLSTINTARDRVGFEAAVMLERLMIARSSSPTHTAVVQADGGRASADSARTSADSVRTSAPETLPEDASPPAPSPRAGSPPQRLVVAPKSVVARRSTDASAIADDDVASAARFIHANAGRPITVDDVVRAATVSRRQLERRFRVTMGHSLLDEVTRCRVDRARQLLADTDLTLEQVAYASGFTSASYFSVVFKRQTTQTPQRYRHLYREVSR